MKLTKTKKAQIIGKIKEWLNVNQSGKGFYIYVEEFEGMVSEIMKSLDLDSYSNTRYFCKEWLEAHNYGIDLSKDFSE